MKNQVDGFKRRFEAIEERISELELEDRSEETIWNLEQRQKDGEQRRKNKTYMKQQDDQINVWFGVPEGKELQRQWLRISSTDERHQVTYSTVPVIPQLEKIKIKQ